jgi:oligoendopeptidase F
MDRAGAGGPPPPAAVARYLALLKSGGSDYPMNQLQSAGVDLTRRETVQAVVEQMDELVSRLEAEAEKIKRGNGA